MTDAQIIAANTTGAYSFGEYGLARWTQEIEDLLAAGFDQEQTEWLMRSKFARWANDMGRTILAEVNAVGRAKVLVWIAEQA